VERRSGAGHATQVPGADRIARHGSPGQPQRFLPGVIAGTRILSAGLAEPGRSDPTSPITKARAADAGAQVAAATQRVHGGMGIDTTYPLHRCFLWAKHNELTLGPATAQLARLGSTYPEGQL
jgi:alkylation response protein AidB-like acyl-CoA dehydrogenase